MNIVFSGLHGTGKSTIAKMIAEEFGLIHHSTGEVFRNLAKEKEMSLEEFSKYVEEHFEIDKELDRRIIEYAKTANDENKNFIFDGQLPAYILDELCDYAIMLKCETDIRIKRMSKRDDQTFADQMNETIAREKSEQERFMEIYGIDVLDPKNILKTYDLIVDTTHLDIDQVFKVCKTAISNYL